MAYEYYNIGVTTTSGSTIFTSNKDMIELTNYGIVPIYFNLSGSSAVTTHYPIYPAETKEIYMRGIGSIHYIVSSGTGSLTITGLVG